MRIEDRLTTSGDRLRAEIEGSVDIDRAMEQAESPVAASSRSRWLLVAAAVVIVVAAIAGAAITRSSRGGEELPVAANNPSTESTTTSEPGGPLIEADIAVDMLGEFPTPDLPVGSISYIGVADALADQWTLSGDTDPVPTIDFEQQAVLAFTTEPSCRELLGLELAGDLVRPFFSDRSALCDVLTQTTHVVAVDRADIPATFDFVLDQSLVGQGGPYALVIDQSENFASFTPHQPGSSGLPAPDGPDLERPEAGREITFDGVGDITLGQTFGPSEFQRHESPEATCGYWGPGEPSHDGDEPLGGLVSIDGDVGTVISIMVRDNPRYRTASGVGVGTTLASLERIYGGDLVVDRTDGWESPTDGLRASYVDVAAVRNGDNALTFYLQGDAVQTVKLSSAEFWGDDEGCA